LQKKKHGKPQPTTNYVISVQREVRLLLCPELSNYISSIRISLPY